MLKEIGRKSMASAIEKLAQLQQEISRRNTDGSEWPGWHDDKTVKLLLFESSGLLLIDYYGRNWDEYWLPVLETLCELEVASCIKTLSFRCLVDGAQGTTEWDFDP